MRRMLLGISIAIFTFVAAADTLPRPGGPFQASATETKAYLSGKTIDFSVARMLPYKYPYWAAFENVKVGNERLAVLTAIGRKGVDFEPISYRKLTTATIVVVPNGGIQIDGDASDWGAITPLLTDPVNDFIDPMYATVPGTDLHQLYIAHDDDYLYFGMTFFNGGPLPNAAYWAEFQQYLYQLHTPGDVSAECYNVGGSGWAVALKDRNGRSMPGYPPGSGYCAAGSGWLEWKAPIEALRSASPLVPYFPAAPVDQGIERRFIRTYIHPIGGGPPSDENDAMTRPLIVDFWD